MATYQQADEETNDLVAEIMKKFHGQLFKAGVSVTTLLAFPKYDDNGIAKGAAIMHHGYPCAGLIKKTSLKDRVAGLQDAILTIDGEQWKDATDHWKRALVDHECQHLEIVLEDETNLDSFKTDDANRPVLRIRRHDWNFGGFEEVIRRHKAEALEYQQVVEVNRLFVQREFNFEGMR